MMMMMITIFSVVQFHNAPTHRHSTRSDLALLVTAQSGVTCSGVRRSTWETATPGGGFWRYFDRLSPHEFKFPVGMFAFTLTFGLMRQVIS